jgi:hypothetical protein
MELQLQRGWYVQFSFRDSILRGSVYRSRTGGYIRELQSVPQKSAELETFLNALLRDSGLHASPNTRDPNGFDIV